MEKGRGKRSHEDGRARNWLFRAFRLKEEKREGHDNAEHESSEKRVKISAIESEIGGRTEVGAEEVGVGDDACEDDCDCRRAGEARESGALESERGQDVGEGIHATQLISWKHENPNLWYFDYLELMVNAWGVL